MPHPPTSVIHDLITEFLDAKIGEGRSTKTIITYRERLLRFSAWLGERPMTRATLRGYLAQMRETGHLSPFTIESYFRDVVVFCNWCFDEGKLPDRIAKGLIPKVPRRRMASYRIDQVKRLLAVCDVRDQALLLTLFDTGVRVSELCGMRRDQIDSGTRTISVIGKGDKERLVRISVYTIEAIETYLNTRTDDLAPLWLGTKGPLSRHGVYLMVKRRAIQAGIRGEVRRLLHSCRATFAREYLKGKKGGKKGDLETLRELLGHERIEQTARYAELANDEVLDLKDEINPLGNILES